MTINPVTIANEGEYCIIASNCCGADTCCFYITVNTPPVIICPPNQTVCAGQKIELSPELPGGTVINEACPTTYSWYFNGNFISNSFTLSISPVTIQNEGKYCIIATNCCGADTCCFTLTVNTPPVIECPQEQIVNAGTNVTFTATLLSGTNDLLCPTTFTWYYGSTVVGTGLTLNLNKVTIENGGQYCLEATNCCGTTRCCVTLIVNTVIVVNVNNITICSNSSGILTATSNSNCITSYIWSTGATSNSITVSTAGTYCVTVTDCNNNHASACGIVTVLPAPTVTVKNILICLKTINTMTANTGEGCIKSYFWSTGATTKSIFVVVPGRYCVTVTGCDGCQAVACGTATLDETVLSCPPNLIVCPGYSATFTVTVLSGTGPFTYQWYNNCSNNTQLITGATNSSYTIPSVSYSNVCLYYCIVNGPCGQTKSCEASLTLGTKPIISIQPTSKCTQAGESVTFSSSSSGSNSYQWQVNSTNINGATNSTFNINPVTSSMCNNIYRVIISNPCGTITSISATLLVMTAPSTFSSIPANNSAVISWNKVCGTGIYYVEYWKTNSEHLTTVVIGTQTILKNLSASTQYYWEVSEFTTNGCTAP